MEQETRWQPQENSQKKLLWKSPSGWRHYAPSHKKAESPTTRAWKAIKGNAALASVLAALLAAVIGLGGVLYQQRVAFDIADQERQETALQTYFDDMAELLLDRDQPLREAKPDDSVMPWTTPSAQRAAGKVVPNAAPRLPTGGDVSIVAQAKTLTVLEALDSEHKKSVVRFLYSAGLIRKDVPGV